MLRRFRQNHPALLRGVMIFLTFFVSFGVGLAYASWAMVCRSGRCPTVEVLDQYQPRQTSKLYASDGKFVAELGLERRTLVRLDEIPKIVQQAFVITEDKRFYGHSGVDWKRVPGAVIANVRAGGFSEGFSTITMQLARNIFPERISREKSVIRKLKEAKVARAIEEKYSKERILELYLNQIYLGNGAYGIESAAQRYFGKRIRDVNLAEAALLAALPKGPERYNPRRFADRALERRNTVLELMRQEGAIGAADANQARAYPLRLASRDDAGDLAPYFVEYVRALLDEKFGAQLYEQGLNVYTTLDIDMQRSAERALERQLRRIEAGQYGAYRHISYERYLARAEGTEEKVSPNSPYLQGAFVALDPRTGAVRALVGGRDFDDNKFNRATQALRQPGSTFKPIVYSTAVQDGRPMSYLVDDAELQVDMGGGPDWRPRNFDGRFAGKIPLRRSLYESRNVSTIRLGMELGEQRVIDMARRFGLTTPIPAYPSIHIGAAEVYPIEMIASYSAFASMGLRTVAQAIVRVETANGEVLWEPQVQRFPVMSQEESWLMISAMKDVVRRGTAAGSVGGNVSVPAGGKTGTTNDGTDVWFIGYTPDLVAGVWMGFDKPKRIKGNAQGGQLAAPVWSAFVNETYRRRRAPSDWPMPMGIVTREIDVGTNMLASAYCPATAVGAEYFIPGTDPMYQCDVHTGYNLYPDTLGLYPPGSYPPGSYPPGTPVDSFRPLPIDTGLRRPRDTMPPPRTVFPRRDSVARPRDSIRPDTLLPPRPRPDTIRPRPDTIRPRPDTIRPRPDTMRLGPDTLSHTA